MNIKADLKSIYQALPHIQDREILAYGSGYALAATLEKLDLKIKYVVDDKPGYEGMNACGIPICPSTRLESEDPEKVFIIIFAYTSHAIQKISGRLKNMGFQYHKDFLDCSIFHFFSVGRELESRFSIQADYNMFLRIRSSSLNSTLNNNSYIAGTWLFCELYRHLCANLEGSIAECGVYTGGNALISMMILPSILEKTYYLFDSFEGFPEISEFDPASRQDDFQGTDFRMIKDRFADYADVKVVKGLFRDTLQRVQEEKFSMVYMDSDLYESTKECCEFFYDRVVPGGILICHDYWVPESDFPDRKNVFTGAQKAMNDFFSDKPEKMIVFPETSHAVVQKK